MLSPSPGAVCSWKQKGVNKIVAWQRRLLDRGPAVLDRGLGDVAHVDGVGLRAELGGHRGRGRGPNCKGRQDTAATAKLEPTGGKLQFGQPSKKCG